MAAPVVAGAAALLLQARPDLNPDQVKALLTQNVNATAAQTGEVDVFRALQATVGAGANQGVKPNPQVEAALVEAGIDPTRATWTRATWTRATWTRDMCATGGAGVDETRSTWSRSTWSSVVEW